MFYFIHHHGSIKIAMVTTLRKIVTISLSILIFKHPMNSYHLTGLALIVSSIAQELFKKETAVNIKAKKE